MDHQSVPRMKPVGLTHVFPFFKTLGGVESVLRRHWNHDAGCGIESQVLAFFEPASGTVDRVVGIGLTWRDSITSARRKFRQRYDDIRRDVVVYHNAWGLPFLADLDRAERRIVLLHSDLPTLDPMLKALPGFVDGILCVSEPLRESVRRHVAGLEDHRTVVIPYPVRSHSIEVSRVPLRDRPIRLGFVGRIVREQKRVDRLPRLCELLKASGLPFQFEVLGEGPDLPWLRKQLSAEPNVIFHGRKDGESYWETLGGWDVIIFVSDYEGLPISLLEALSAGVIPIYPRIGSGGDSYARAVRSDLLYPPGELAVVVELLVKLRETPSEEIARMRSTGREQAQPHQGDAYERSFAGFVRAVGEAHRISARQFRSRPFFWSDLLPFGLLRRFYYHGLFARTPAL